MKISKKAQRESKRLFRACLREKTLDEGRVRQTVRQVLEQRPRNYLPVILHFQRLVRLELRRRQAAVQSAVALAPASQEAMRTRLSGLYGPGLDFAFGQDPALVGGLRVQVGDDVFDGSIRSRLDALEASF
jgi:F-type H+-transporting ATPase subunit delta